MDATTASPIRPMTMNTRKIKLALTVGLINSGTQHNVNQAIQDVMADLQEEVGAFLGLRPVRRSPLGDYGFREEVSYQYENCTLNVDVVHPARTAGASVQRFRLN